MMKSRLAWQARGPACVQRGHTLRQRTHAVSQPVQPSVASGGSAAPAGMSSQTKASRSSLYSTRLAAASQPLQDYQRQQLLRRVTSSSRAVPVRQSSALLLVQRTGDAGDWAQLCAMEALATSEALASGRAYVSSGHGAAGYYSVLQPQHFIAMLARVGQLMQPLAQLRQWYSLQQQLAELPGQLAQVEAQLACQVSLRSAAPNPPPASHLRAKMRQQLGRAKARAAQRRRVLERALAQVRVSQQQQLLHLVLQELAAKLLQGLPRFRSHEVLAGLAALRALATSSELSFLLAWPLAPVVNGLVGAACRRMAGMEAQQLREVVEGIAVVQRRVGRDSCLLLQERAAELLASCASLQEAAAVLQHLRACGVPLEEVVPAVAAGTAALLAAPERHHPSPGTGSGASGRDTGGAAAIELLHAFAQAQQLPPAAWLQAAMQLLQHHLAQHSLLPGQLATLAASLAALVPPEPAQLLQLYMSAVAQQLQAADPGQVVAMLEGCAQLQQLPSPHSQLELGSEQAQVQQAELSALVSNIAEAKLLGPLPDHDSTASGPVATMTHPRSVSSGLSQLHLRDVAAASQALAMLGHVVSDQWLHSCEDVTLQALQHQHQQMQPHPQPEARNPQEQQQQQPTPATQHASGKHRPSAQDKRSGTSSVRRSTPGTSDACQQLLLQLCSMLEAFTLLQHRPDEQLFTNAAPAITACLASVQGAGVAAAASRRPAKCSILGKAAAAAAEQEGGASSEVQAASSTACRLTLALAQCDATVTEELYCQLLASLQSSTAQLSGPQVVAVLQALAGWEAPVPQPLLQALLQAVAQQWQQLQLEQLAALLESLVLLQAGLPSVQWGQQLLKRSYVLLGAAAASSGQQAAAVRRLVRALAAVRVKPPARWLQAARQATGRAAAAAGSGEAVEQRFLQ